jgi:hypothetical protein
LPPVCRLAFFRHDGFPQLYPAPGKPASVPFPVTWDGATLIDLLATMPLADAARTANGCAIVVLSPVAPATVAVLAWPSTSCCAARPRSLKHLQRRRPARRLDPRPNAYNTG